MNLSLISIAWLAGAGVVATAIVVMIVRNARPTPSVAHVLYDVQHPDLPRR